MSIQWTLVAGFLYLEIIAVVLLLLPFLRPRTWQKFFKSRFLRSIENQANIYFMVFIVILVLFFLDSMREMTKYSGDLNTDHERARPVDAELQHSMKLFRAQRNFYIAGFALFLLLVIRRLVTLLTALAQLDIQVEVTMKQAKGASEAAKSMMKDEKSAAGGDKASRDKEVAELKELLKKKEKELAKALSNEEAVKKQAKNLTEEYDRLTSEHQKLLKKQYADGDNKKDN
uniref:Endoplasmic reticulum transmembrane protein n=1 Tax=Aceria tosichella TaxID=561515 RepID=A0A6G1SKY8_9ACAR